jgi:hypothetical protein
MFQPIVMTFQSTRITQSISALKSLAFLNGKYLITSHHHQTWDLVFVAKVKEELK